MSTPLRVRALRALVYRCPLETPVVTSFGTMRDRPMVLVRAEDEDGAVGWGEAWCNFPAVGAEHRARLVESLLAPLVEQRAFEGPREALRWMSEKTAVLAIQCAEPGPFAKAIAGVDIALWDLAARRAGQPLWRLLGGAGSRVRVYASGLNPEGPEVLAAVRQREGFRAFKLKVGFGAARDAANLAALRATLGAGAELMVDANQAWDLGQACDMAGEIERFDVRWLEEPLRADRPWSEWQALRARTRIPLAAGENLIGEAAFASALASGALGVVQPDAAKWGGVTGCLAVARRIRASGARYCPHYLGGGVGLLASAHLLAAAGGEGLLEIDANPNPLRTLTCGALESISEGHADLGEAPGLGPEPDLERLRDYAVAI